MLRRNLGDTLRRKGCDDSFLRWSMLRRNLGDTLRRKGCDDSFLRWSMLRRNPSGTLRRKVPWALHFGAFLVQIPCVLLKCSLGP
ncbi:hypothetical protein Tco_0207562 [Tanacetum coccineum]